jgi:hypothetical protein
MFVMTTATAATATAAAHAAATVASTAVTSTTGWWGRRCITLGGAVRRPRRRVDLLEVRGEARIDVAQLRDLIVGELELAGVVDQKADRRARGRRQRRLVGRIRGRCGRGIVVTCPDDEDQT